MKKKIYFLLTTLLIPLSLFAAKEKSPKAKPKYNFNETVNVPLPHLYLSKWQVGYQNITKTGTAVTRYFLSTESKENWTQIINIQFKDKAHLKELSLENVIEEEARNSSWVTSKTHSKKQNDILYEREFPTGEHELVRMILTKNGLHRIAYIKRGPLSQEEREQWVDRLSKGTIQMQEKVKAAKAKKA